MCLLLSYIIYRVSDASPKCFGCYKGSTPEDGCITYSRLCNFPNDLLYYFPHTIHEHRLIIRI